MGKHKKGEPVKYHVKILDKVDIDKIRNIPPPNEEHTIDLGQPEIIPPEPPPPQGNRVTVPRRQRFTPYTEDKFRKKYEYSYFLLNREKLHEAERVLKDISTKAPSAEEEARAWTALGVLHEKMGKWEEAYSDFKKGYEADKKDSYALDRLITNTLLMDKPEEALKYYKILEKQRRLNPIEIDVKAQIYLHLGAKRKMEGDPRWKEDAQKADEIIKYLLSLKKEEPEYWISKGGLEILRDNKKEAIKAYERAIELKPDMFPEMLIDIYTSLYFMYSEIGDKEKALYYINKLTKFMDHWTPKEFGRTLYTREYALLYKEIILGKDVNPGLIFKHKRLYKEFYRRRIQRPVVEVDQTLFILSEMVDMEWEGSLEDCLDEVTEFMSLAEGPKYPECFSNKMVNRRIRYILGYVMYGDVYYHFLKKKKAIEYYKKALKLSPNNPFIIEKLKKAEKL